MKKNKIRVLSVSMAVALALSVGVNFTMSKSFADVVSPAAAESTSYNGSITFVHYDGEETVKYTKGSDKLVNSHVHEGLIRQYQYNFLGWSDMPEKADGNLQEGATLYRQGESLEKAFPKGFKGTKKLYGIYVRFIPDVDNKPEETAKDIKFLQDGVSKDNKISILDSADKNVTAEGVLPNTKQSDHPDNKFAGQDGKGNNKVVIDNYKKDTVNEIVLRATFKMNKKIALLVHKNPGEILTKTYEKGLPSEENAASQGEKSYSYVDMVFNIDKRANMPENLHLKFTSNSWRPVYALDENGNPMSISKIGGTDLGNTANSFDSLVSKNSPEVTFTVKNPKKSHKITIRAIIRTGDKINKDLDPNKIMNEHMKLEAFTKSELNSKYNLGIDEKNADQNLVTIPDAVAKQLADSNGKDRIKVSGYIKGVARAVLSAPYIATYDFLSVPIEKVEANNLLLSYVNAEKDDNKKDEPKKPDEKKDDTKKDKSKDKAKDNSGAKKAPKTGDDNNLLGLGSIIAMSVLGVVATRKKQEK